MYDPFTGRFLQQDPLEDFFPGESPYGYAYHNPVMFNDPTGLAPEKEKGGEKLLVSCDRCIQLQMRYDFLLQSALNGVSEEFLFKVDGELLGEFSGMTLQERFMNMNYLVKVAKFNIQEILECKIGTGANSPYKHPCDCEDGAKDREGIENKDEEKDKEEISEDDNIELKHDNSSISSSDILMGSVAISGVLLADDVTVVGVTDDVAIPFVLVGGAVTAGVIWLLESSEHEKNKQKKNWDKHTNPRSGRANTKNRQNENWQNNPNKETRKKRKKR